MIYWVRRFIKGTVLFILASMVCMTIIPYIPDSQDIKLAILKYNSMFIRWLRK